MKTSILFILFDTIVKYKCKTVFFISPVLSDRHHRQGTEQDGGAAVAEQ